MGRPTGGPQDMLPPVFIKSEPAPEARNVHKNKVEITFDELIQLKDQNDKVVISPVQKTPASIRTAGKKVVIEFRDSMIPNTTYSIDFSDAIQDLNEGNAIDGFSYAFSTGDSIDSLQISGILLKARDLEPQQKMLVGVHKDLSDSAFYKEQFYRIARTNDLGQFTIRNLKPGKYHLFALNDVDRDYKFANPSEDIAFFDSIIIPSAKSYSAVDTIFTATHKIDTILDATHTKYLPNDILLSLFNEERASQYLVKDERMDSTKLFIQFSTKADTLPELKLLDYTPTLKEWYRLDKSATNDTLTYWLTDKNLIHMDTIRVAASFLRTDTTQHLKMGTDTLLFKMKKIKTAKKKKKKEDGDTIPEIDLLNFNILSSTSQDVNLPLWFRSEAPIDTIYEKGVHLQIMEDTLWKDLPNISLKRANSLSQLLYKIDYDWEPGGKYKLTVDSASIYSIYNLYNKKIEHNFAVKALEDYADLEFTVNVKDSAVVELLTSDDKVLRSAPVINGKADFPFLNPGIYYARLFIDRNGNGKYDTGNYAEKLQPEEVYYYNKKLNLKKNWEITENWDIYALPVDKQKPQDIKKNKPATKKWEKDKTKKKTGHEEEEEESPFGVNQFQNGKDVFQNNNYNKRNY